MRPETRKELIAGLKSGKEFEVDLDDDEIQALILEKVPAKLREEWLAGGKFKRKFWTHCNSGYCEGDHLVVRINGIDPVRGPWPGEED